jgi:hypothetical protein
MKKIWRKGLALQEDIKDLIRHPDSYTTERNPQALWSNFKYTTVKWAELVIKNTRYKQAMKLKNLKKDRKDTLDHLNFAMDQDLQWNKALLMNKIEYLEKKNSKDNRNITRAKILLHGEKLGSMWTTLSKTRKPRDVMQKLKVPDSNPQRHETRSNRMTELTRNYHDNIQNRDLDPAGEETRRQAI